MSATPWTTYHDMLFQEKLALMLELGWTSDSQITARLEEITEELDEASQSLGQVPKLDPQTGEPLLDGQGNIVYQSATEQMGQLFSQFEQARIAADDATENRYQQLVGTPEQQQGIFNYWQLAQNAQSQYFDPASQTFAGMFNNAITPEQALEQYQNAWGDPTQQGSLANQYETTRQRALGAISGIGDQAAADITSRYDQALASGNQQLSSRGLGNTTVGLGMEQSYLNQESAEQRRLQESLAQLNANYEATLGSQANQAAMGMMGGGLGAWQDAYGMRNQLGSQYASYLNQAGSQMAGLWANPLQVIEGRTDTSPTYADVANIAMQVGINSANQYALPGFQSPTTYQQNQG